MYPVNLLFFKQRSLKNNLRNGNEKLISTSSWKKNKYKVKSSARFMVWMKKKIKT